MYCQFIAATLIAFNLAGCSNNHVSLKSTASGSLPEGIVLISEKSKNEEGVFIPYKKYQLSNGLTVILHEDDSDPLVHVDVTYHVGSAREDVGKSGFAHFFEHMMFQGSKHVGDDMHFQIITEAGGNLNGTTNSDRTNYYQTIPANQLEKVLWLEADRMGFLLDSVTQEKFEVQRETVKNERAQRIDNQPYGLRDEVNSEALYPNEHPYSWPVIGYVEDLDRVNVNDLKAFFTRWYGPNNAILTIGGDFDELTVLKWVNKYFGSIPSGEHVYDQEKNPVTLPETRFVTLEDEVHLPLLQVTFPTVHVRHEDEAALDVLSHILGEGKTSLFYKNLVKPNRAVQAVVSHPCRELACEFQLIALANPSKVRSLSELYAMIDKTLNEFESRGVLDEDLQRTKAQIEAATVFGLQSVAGKVSTLASNEFLGGEPDLVDFDINRYSNVTKKDVTRVYNRYIKNQPRVVLSIVPTGQTQLAASPTNYASPERDLSQVETVSEFVAPQNIVDNFDRSVMPAATINPAVQVPEVWRHQMSNGIEVIGHFTSETPTVTLTLSMEGGPLLDPIDKAGLASITASLMNETTERFSTEEIANQLALLGSSISFTANGRFTEITLVSLTKHLDETLLILKEKLFSPKFEEVDFNRVKYQILQSLQQQYKQPNALMSIASKTVLYGADNRIGLPDMGTINTIQNITLEDVKSFYTSYYSPSKGSMVVVGNVPKKALLEKVDFLSSWSGKSYDIAPYQPFPENTQPSIYLVDKPGAAQSVVKILKRSLPYDATDKQFKAKLMNFPLGGMFNSRINMNLREDKGYTYGASTAFIGGVTLGQFVASSNLNAQNTVEGIQEMLAEIETYQRLGMSEDELDTLRAAYTQSEALQYETPASKAQFLRHLLVYGLDTSYRQSQLQIIESISKRELNLLASELLDVNTMQIIVVGDANRLESALNALDRPIVKMNVVSE
ncbi:insulinase family protein [Aestuariibacter sp. AA17]|uniref:Insulinase family protein n=1 Tax=Fluctibacter corallii TaxID=2984329 RepID=A0ABT3A358_9ALTE|nr:pitrilysin family protein [Aestuariibacter sp. AA17]MCV2883106.1 insulinase family protein [Aestuariibacter sp. AA17]